MLVFGPSALSTLIIFHYIQLTTAFFRLATSVLVTERADPVVSPGKASGHAHSITGGFNFGTTLTFEQLRDSKCTSSGVQQDMSAYWTPLVYFWHKNGSFIAPAIQNQGQLIYYKYNIDEDNEPFPEGFRMMGGQPLARTYDPPPGIKEYTYYDCLDGGTNLKSYDFPKQVCPAGTRMNVFFPRCGDGRLESKDRTHVAYQVDGKCPESHPHLYPQLHYELYFANVEDPANGIIWADAKTPGQPFVLSNGDPTGYGAHGDFFNGWDTAILGQALKTCTGEMGANLGDGRAETCPLFTIVDGKQCKKEGVSPDLSEREQVAGWLPKLPGCNLITYTEEEARRQAEAGCGDDAKDEDPPSPSPPAKPVADVGDDKPPSDDTKPAAEENEPSTDNTKPAADIDRPPADDSKPAAADDSRPTGPTYTPPTVKKKPDCSRRTVTSTVRVTASPGGKLRRHIILM